MAAKRRRRSRGPVAHARKQPPEGRPLRWRVPTEEIGIAGLIILGLFFLTTSWRKWPDPLIDFGRELYFPWRISHGAVLYRDLEGHYGPLSQYLNGLIFALFGPGLMILVAANLAVLVAILTILYLLCRRAWGRIGAFAAIGVFLSVFAFSQFVGVSNYNYAAPYAHETTHGMLVSLGLVLVLCRWVEKPTWRWSLLAGILYGLTFVLKPEFILAGAVAGIAALLLRSRYHSFPSLAVMGAALVGVVVPTLFFAVYFAAFVPLRRAFFMAAGAWLRFVSGSAGASVAAGIQSGFSGADKASSHLTQHLVATALACLLIAAVAALGWLSKRIPNNLTLGLLTAISAALFGWISWSVINWVEIGRSFFGLTLIYLAVCVGLILFAKLEQDNLWRDVPKILLAIAGLALMARMALNGRIYHYGFYQAAIAGTILPAILVGELPQWLRSGIRERAVILVILSALLIPGVWKIARSSQGWMRMKTASIGEGIDQFYTYPRNVEYTGELVDAVTKSLKQENRINSLLVVPEGIMINYLARIPSTVPYYFFASTNPALVAELEVSPPDRVVIISRDLREYGIERYGDEPGQGKEVLDWVTGNYDRYAHAGGNPLDYRHRGAVFFKRRPLP